MSETLPTTPSGSSPTRGAIRFTTFADIGLEGIDRPHLVAGFLPLQAVCSVYGPFGSGKTAMLLHLALCLITGRRFFSRNVLPSAVLYVAAESADSTSLRVRAIRKAYERELAAVTTSESIRFQLKRNKEGGLIKPLKLYRDDDGNLMRFPKLKRELVLAERGIDLFTEELADQTQSELVAKAKAIGARLIVLDTLSQATPGMNENAPNDGSLVLNRLKRMAEETGATVIFVHHTGKNLTLGQRGHVVLSANAEELFEVLDGIGQSSGHDYVRIANMRTKTMDRDESDMVGRVTSVALRKARRVVVKMTDPVTGDEIEESIDMPATTAAVVQEAEVTEEITWRQSGGRTAKAEQADKKVATTEQDKTLRAVYAVLERGEEARVKSVAAELGLPDSVVKERLRRYVGSGLLANLGGAHTLTAKGSAQTAF